MRSLRSPVLVLALALGLAAGARSQQPTASDSSRLTVARIFGGEEFRAGSYGPLRWLAGGSAYTTLEASAATPAGKDIVRYDVASGARSVLVPAARLIPAGDTVPLSIEDYSWSPDGSKLLVFTHSKQVWRANTRGDYWVLDRATWRLRKLGGNAPASTLMFAKFSPDGRRVGYVRQFNLYVEDLATGRITRLTRDGSRTVINGTFDWVYEEELGLRDGWRWSPDGREIAFWRLDAAGVRDFDLINDTDSLYSFVKPVQYPKAGETNSAARVGVVSAAGGPTRWMKVPGDPRNNYIARMEWSPPLPGAPRELVIQHLNRLQDTVEVMLADAATGNVRTILTDTDSAWTEIFPGFTFLKGGREFLWQSERDGWTHLYVVSRSTGALRLVTPGDFDVLDFLGVDTASGFAYYVASPGNPTQRYLYRAPLAGGAADRLSPANEPGSHSYDIAPDFKYAVHTWSSFGTPAVTELVELPAHRPVRTLVDNAQLKARVSTLARGRSEFRQVDIGDGIRLNAWMILPPAFDSTKRYPVLFAVYGGPGSQTVVDSWGGNGYLWDLLLAQHGYIVASVDNRGTGARGRAWRKIVYRRLGVVETRDQAAAARAIGRLPFVDSTRIGIWGWSYGGFMTLNCILQFPDVYRTAVAVAPVTHWKFYDDIYTERYNGLPQNNAAGYDQGSPLTYANNLRGNLLIVHGSGDDNVHYQNTENMVNALVAANRQFRLFVYPNRSHSISGGNTTLHLWEMLTAYVLEKL